MTQPHLKWTRLQEIFSSPKGADAATLDRIKATGHPISATPAHNVAEAVLKLTLAVSDHLEANNQTALMRSAIVDLKGLDLALPVKRRGLVK